jgi:hypothetical protein
MTSKSSCTDWPAYYEGVGSWASYSNNNKKKKKKSWEGEETLPYTLACTVKSRPGSRRHQMAKREEEEKAGLSVLPELGCLATYRGYVSHVSICLCYGWYLPYHDIASFAGWEYLSFTIRGRRSGLFALRALAAAGEDSQILPPERDDPARFKLRDGV